MTFLSSIVEQFARAHTEATRAALAHQRRQAGHKPPHQPPKQDVAFWARPAPRAETILDRLHALNNRRRRPQSSADL